MSRGNPGFEGGHILVDFDGTLAKYDSGGYRTGHCGEPIPEMVERVKKWLNEGRDVRIFTARRYTGGSLRKLQESAKDVAAIEVWCGMVFGRVLPIVNQKNMSTDAIFDDIASSVEHNVGSWSNLNWRYGIPL